MSTPQTVKAQMQSLIDKSNATTGKIDTNLTDAVDSLIKLVVAEKLDLKVEITYTDGKIVNSGLDTSITVGAYRINATNDGFETSELARYTTGMDGDANGATMLQHDHLTTTNGGAYTVVKDYEFGTNDFAISIWFNVPSFSTEVSSNSNTYLFGTNHPDADSGFSVGLKPGNLRFDVSGTLYIPTISYNKDVWNNVVLCRENNNLHLYFNGELKSTAPIDDVDFNVKDLSFGGYYGWGNNYHKNWMYYDNIQVYNKALTLEQINKYILTPINGDNTETE